MRKDDQDLDTTRRSIGHDRAFQRGNGKETSAGSRYQLYLGGREHSGWRGGFVQIDTE